MGRLIELASDEVHVGENVAFSSMLSFLERIEKSLVSTELKGREGSSKSLMEESKSSMEEDTSRIDSSEIESRLHMLPRNEDSEIGRRGLCRGISPLNGYPMVYSPAKG